MTSPGWLSTESILSLLVSRTSDVVLSVVGDGKSTGRGLMASDPTVGKFLVDRVLEDAWVKGRYIVVLWHAVRSSKMEAMMVGY